MGKLSNMAEMTQSAGKAMTKAASALGNAVALEKAIINVAKKQTPALKAESIKSLFNLLNLGSAEKLKKLAKMATVLVERLGTVAKKYGVKAVGKSLGFANDEKFANYIKNKLLKSKPRDKNLKEFEEGAIGRQNDFLGDLFELSIKYGPIREVIYSIASNALDVLNSEIMRASKNAGITMFNAEGGKTIVKTPFSNLLTANRIDIGTVDGVKESLDFGSIGFNLFGNWTLPLPVEIKLPRAAAGVAVQFASFPERAAAALNSKNSIFAFFTQTDFEKFRESVSAETFRKFMLGHKNLGVEEIDGRAMVKLSLDPRKLLFAAEVENPMANNRMLVRPDSRFWNPADPEKIPMPEREKIFQVSSVNNRPVSIEISSTEKGGGFIFWRMLIPTEKRYLVDIYKSVFDLIE